MSSENLGDDLDRFDGRCPPFRKIERAHQTNIIKIARVGRVRSLIIQLHCRILPFPRARHFLPTQSHFELAKSIKQLQRLKTDASETKYERYSS